MMHVMSARCVARDLHTIAPGPLERATVGDGSRRNEEIVKKMSNCAFECHYHYYHYKMSKLESVLQESVIKITPRVAPMKF